MESEGESILIVEDHDEVSAPLARGLERLGYRGLVAPTLGMARRLLERRSFALIVLDVALPDGEGFELLREVRRRDSTPVVMLTARDEGRDKVAALDWGADDYITKPFWFEEVAARVRAALRRAHPEPVPAAAEYAFGSLLVRTDRREVSVGGAPVELTPTEWRLLVALIEAAGRPIHSARLFARVLPGDDAASQALQAHVSRLRKKLGPEAARVQTVWGVGYRLDVRERA